MQDRFLSIQERRDFWQERLSADRKGDGAFVLAGIMFLAPVLGIAFLMNYRQEGWPVAGFFLGLTLTCFFVLDFHPTTNEMLKPLRMSISSMFPMTAHDRDMLRSKKNELWRYSQLTDACGAFVLLVLVLIAKAAFDKDPSYDPATDLHPLLNRIVITATLLLALPALFETAAPWSRRLKTEKISFWHVKRVTAITSLDSVFSIVLILAYLLLIRGVFSLLEVAFPSADPSVWNSLYMPVLFLLVLIMWFQVIMFTARTLGPLSVFKGSTPLWCIAAAYAGSYFMRQAEYPGWLSTTLACALSFLLTTWLLIRDTNRVPARIWLVASCAIVAAVGDYVLSILLFWLRADFILWITVATATLCSFFLDNLFAASDSELAESPMPEPAKIRLPAKTT